MISFDDFGKVELRTAKVVEVREHPNADRLLVLRLDVGELGERQIVAGIRGHYSAENLTGRTIVIVSNLEPVTLRGEESHGMLLAVKDEDAVRVLTPDGLVGSGLRVT
jgi:methionyl-tRNA synthetase